MARSKRRPRYSLATIRSRVQPGITDRLGAGILLIWAMTFAPLYDGVFFSAVASGQLALSSGDGTWPAIAFGATCFSGGGAIAGALTLTGTIRRRLLSLVGVYLVIAAGAFAEIVMLAWTPWQVPDHANVAGAFVLIVLATVMLRWKIVLTPTVMLLVLLALASAIWLQDETATMTQVRFDAGAASAATVLAIATGFVATTSVALLSGRLTRWLDPAWITRAGATSVAAIALTELGLPVPSWLTIAVLAGGALLPPVLRSRTLRRLRCVPRARRIRRVREAAARAGVTGTMTVPVDVHAPVGWSRLLARTHRPTGLDARSR
jgi:uncharacterized membrane protein